MACTDGVDTQNRERHGQVETQEGGHTSPRGECVPSRTTGTGADSRFPHKQDGGCRERLGFLLGSLENWKNDDPNGRDEMDGGAEGPRDCG